MKNSVKFVTSYHGMHMNTYLVVENGQAFLLCYEHEKDQFGFMCPCCMFPEHRQAITEAVSQGLREDAFTGKVIWCCHQSDAPEYGNHLASHDFNKDLFTGDSLMANRLSAETKALIR